MCGALVNNRKKKSSIRCNDLNDDGDELIRRKKKDNHTNITTNKWRDGLEGTYNTHTHTHTNTNTANNTLIDNYINWRCMVEVTL